MKLRKIFLNFLLQNQNPGQIVFKNIFWLFSAEVLSGIFKLLLFILSARILGSENYGRFSFALAFVGLFLFLADFGLNQILTRELSKFPEKEKEIKAFIALKIFLGLFAFLLIFASSFFITKDPVSRLAIYILGAMILVHSFGELFFSVLRARQRMEIESLVRIFESFLTTVLGVFILFKIPSVLALSFVYFLGAFLAVLILALYFHQKIAALGLDFNFSLWKKLVASSWPLAFVGIFAMIYNQIDSVMMGFWNQLEATGFYNAAYRIVGAAMIPAALLGQAFFPQLALAVKKGKEDLQKVWDRLFQLSLFLGLPLAVGGVLTAKKIIVDFLYGESFLPAVLAFQILILMAGVFYLNNSFSRLLVAKNLQKKNFWIAFWGALFNIGTNFYFIPKYSLYGAAFTTLATFVLMLFLFWLEARKIEQLKIFSLSSKKFFIDVFFATFLMGLVLKSALLQKGNIFLVVLLGLLVYLISFYFFTKKAKKS
jgi:O-antigen/teichoic acid export membrane protein